MSQPIWKLIANLGDATPADHGGFLVYVDETGVYRPEVEVYEPNDGETGGTVYRFVLDPPRFKTFTADGWDRKDFDVPAKRGVTWTWHKEWWVEKLPDVARSCGLSARQLIRDAMSCDPRRLAIVYQCVTGYIGCYEFDQDPLTLTETEAQERYARDAVQVGKVASFNRD